MSAALADGCDRGLAAAARGGRAAHRHPQLTLAATILASSLAFIDGSVVNVALPAIGRSLDASAAELQWVINAYLLPLSALLLLGGAAGDRFGRRQMFLGGILVFAVASLICTVAPSVEWLLAGRALQGIGSAMLMPNSLAILGSAFAGEERGKAIGVWAAAGAAAGAVGPLIGGWLVDAADWRMIFLINLPLAAGALWLGWRYVVADVVERGEPLDIAGVALATIGLAALTWGLTAWSAGLGGAGLWSAAGIAALLAFVWVEHRRGARAIMPLAMFGTSSFIGLSLLTLLLYGALGGMLVALPWVLIERGGYSAVEAGAALLPMPLVISTVSRRAGALAARIGARLPLSLGPVLVAAGFALASRIDPAGSYWTSVLPALLLISFGMAGAVAPLTTAVMAAVDAEHVGAANGFNSALARTGGLFATALLGALLSQQGAALLAAFQAAAWAAAGLALLAGAAAFLLLKPEHSRR